MNSAELATLLKGKLLGSRYAFAKGFSIDSRRVKQGDVFIALRGQKDDGHNYLGEAFSKGAVGAIVQRDGCEPPPGKFLIKVKDTFEALRDIARYRRKTYRGKVIAVAGSVGKTTTKELIHHLLCSVGRAYKSEGNLNSRIGLPLVLANMDMDSDFAVLELGASAVGDVLELTKLSEPKVRVITALGEEHLEGFGSIENVIKGNGEIFWGFGGDDCAVIPAYAKRFYPLEGGRVLTFGDGGDIRADNVALSLKGTSFEFMGHEVSIPVLSKGIVDNVLASLGVVHVLGYEPPELIHRLRGFKPPQGRMNLIKLGDAYLIDDTYNANPPSVRNALETLALVGRNSKKVALLGDMLELGKESEKLHREVGKLVVKLGIDFAIFYGTEMKFAYDACQKVGGNCVYTMHKEEVIELVLKWLRHKNIILIKGSRGMRMEFFLEKIRGIVEDELQ